MKKDKLIIIAGGVLLIFLVIGAYFFLSNRKTSNEAVLTPPEETEDVFPAVSAQDLGLTFSARADGKAVKFEISNASDIASIDYEISYLAEGNIPRGVIGSITKAEEEETIAIDYEVLGSCSSGKCKYDAGVTSVKLILRILKTDGKTYQTEETLDL